MASGGQYSHFSALQLMTEQGLLLQPCHSQRVSVRVAGEFLPAAQPRTGHWSRNAYSVTITPGQDLLLSCQPSHTWGKQFRASSPAAARGYLALYDTLSDSITAALGEQRGQSSFQRGLLSYVCPLSVCCNH